MQKYLTILQLSDIVEAEDLERAYGASVSRYERLTARGPLRHYRGDLLEEAAQAYRMLKAAGRGQSDEKYFARDVGLDSTQEGRRMTGGRAVLRAREPSVAARRAAALGYDSSEKKPIDSAVKEGSILSDKPLGLRGRSVEHWREKSAHGSGPAEARGTATAGEESEKAEKRRRDLIEDNFCREVIYRLEGDLIRFTSRRQLLRMAQEWKIPIFRANMLMAQIVESVRQNKLYEPSGGEKSSKKARRRAQRQEARRRARGGKRKGWILIGIVILLAAAADAVMIRYLGRGIK